MQEPQQHIAKIERTFIGFEDHGLLTAYVSFTYGSSAQSLGPRSFGSMTEKEPEKWRDAHERGMDYIRRVLLACGVDQWEKLKGRTVLVTATYTEILKIEPLPTEKGKPFDIREWAEADMVTT